jgi:hypothetical protein
MRNLRQAEVAFILCGEQNNSLCDDAGCIAHIQQFKGSVSPFVCAAYRLTYFIP